MPRFSPAHHQALYAWLMIHPSFTNARPLSRRAATAPADAEPEGGESSALDPVKAIVCSDRQAASCTGMAGELPSLFSILTHPLDGV